MNYNKPELSEELAKRYVLGVMSGRARRRFKHLMMLHQSLKDAVWQWEQCLSPMADAIEELPPSNNVWRGIVTRLGWKKQTPSLFQKFSNWLAVSATALLVITFGWFSSIPPKLETDNIAILQTDVKQVAWLIKDQAEHITIIAEQPPQATQEQDFELWMLPADGKAPISLGLLPKNGIVRISKAQLPKAVLASGLAVSLEPLGGSTTGAPTGPVILTAKWLNFKQV